MRTYWSQNFLIDKNIAKKSIESLSLQPEDILIEIGPGKGILTEEALPKCKKVFAIEIDRSLCDFLRKRFEKWENLEVIQYDFLKYPLKDLENLSSRKFKVLGNLPYAVVPPILQKVLCWDYWSIAIFMVQKEVAQRILAQPGSKNHGILSLSVQLRSRIQLLQEVSHHCFRPQPKVESTLLKFFPKESLFKESKEEEYFYKTVRASFSHKRKTILNSLARSLKLPSQKIRETIEMAGLSPESRAESLNLDDFKKLTEMLPR